MKQAIYWKEKKIVIKRNISEYNFIGKWLILIYEFIFYQLKMGVMRILEGCLKLQTF